MKESESVQIIFTSDVLMLNEKKDFYGFFQFIPTHSVGSWIKIKIFFHLTSVHVDQKEYDLWG